MSHSNHLNRPALNASQTGENDITISQTLLGPIALLSAHLKFLRATLSPSVVVVLYRSIASRLAEHILQRQILYRGQISLREGQNVLAECDLWLEACQGALGGGRNRVESPWLKMIEASRIVASDGNEWKKIVALTNGGLDDADWESGMLEVVGSNELTRELVQRIIRRRGDL